ncbi:MAG: hypothetical protein KatS3mg063_1547 [Tepidiforma sp.]|uniref:glycine-rich domain-containing protein n=1 Tax=Tepidiforma sp. TaxID=2682230 RepID=UPI0021DE89A4|nr:hypothetical protein [Tepidiforma sp.]GIW15694.1 MAG: hypothetical protein KatS3mg063_1547 [Tepidiforma sp.]
MAREIYTAGGVITGLATSWQDVVPLVATGEVILVRVRAVNRGSAATTVTAALWDSSAELARVLHQVSIAVGEVHRGGRPRRGRAAAAGTGWRRQQHRHQHRAWREAGIMPIQRFPTAPSIAIERFDASGTWYKPAWAKYVEVICIGAGGGGGGAYGGSYGGGGGGGGARVGALFRAADLPSSVTVTVGAGGAAGSNGTPGTAGGNWRVLVVRLAAVSTWRHWRAASVVVPAWLWRRWRRHGRA